MKNSILFFLAIVFISSSNCIAQKTNYDNNKSAGKYASINGIKLYYEIYGKGEPLLLLHGNGGNMSAFRNQIPFFAQHYKVIAVDSRLQGKSGGDEDTLSYDMMADDFCKLLDYLHVDSAFVLGWSDGGINGLLMAMHCPEKVKCLAISGANTIPDSTAISNADLDDMRNTAFNNDKVSKKEKTLNRMMIYQPVIPFPELSKIKCPVLVMAGDHDIIKPEHTVKIFQSLPNAQLCIFPNSSHSVCQVHPALFNSTVYNFFKELKTKTSY